MSNQTDPIEMPKAEYRAFVDMIQNNEIDLTDELREDTISLLDSVQDESLETIQRAKMLVERMHGKHYTNRKETSYNSPSGQVNKWRGDV